MSAELIPFSDEETRVLINLEQQYEVWIEAGSRLKKGEAASTGGSAIAH